MPRSTQRFTFRGHISKWEMLLPYLEENKQTKHIKTLAMHPLTRSPFHIWMPLALLQAQGKEMERQEDDGLDRCPVLCQTTHLATEVSGLESPLPTWKLWMSLQLLRLFPGDPQREHAKDTGASGQAGWEPEPTQKDFKCQWDKVRAGAR